ncbi:MAG TPA: S8 family serine peptidase [Propionicimonas sp.]|uniref:S8 family serine peptidase n=1 Tax=Propionicimonas sp. TaxID=1955623 RepID=UPI002F3FDA0D
MSSRRRILIVTAALALAVPTVATAAPNPSHDLDHTGTAGPVGTTFVPRILDKAGPVTVMVQLKGDPVAVAEAKASRSFSTAQRSTVKKALRKAQDAISDDIAARGGTVLSHLQSAYNGMRVRIARSKVTSLSALPGVVAVHTVTPRTLDNTVSVPYLGVPQVWQSTGYTGKGVKVGIIDTGIDYTHADFGGPGTEAAFATASANSDEAADPALFGPSAPRVKGGYDFVGDAYDPGAAAGSPALTPRPDLNPLDCNGHGSHVAGTTGGSGVTGDGATYAGPYDASTPGKTFKVGPGVAPEVDLYALRVFGCEGATDVVTEAIDWAVDHKLDVINMSLGSSYGRSDSPDAVAASNAVAAGVVVVTSAGNSGQNPYLVGSPAVGQGVLAVSAVDSTPTFPGANLTVGSTTIPAINANGATLPAGGFTIVRLVDDPATATENEALGCSKAAYTKAGITAAGTVIAVVDRGTCARAAKPIFGQQAGADAVVMINNAATYPPYEGPITSNPDDGSPFTVTIPFLGVRNSDGPKLTAAAGQTLTLAAASLDNPGFNRYASFTSAGPASGDSGLSPNLAAPGVSIASAGVGTGTEAAIISGTSMAAPHVAGVAALGVQAHPTWPATAVAAALANTADPEKVADYDVTIGGGLVDAAQTVATTTYVTGDSFRTSKGRVAEGTLSFGFDEPRKSSVGTRTLTIHNRGTTAVTYALGSDPSTDVPATVRLSSRSVRVPAGGTARVAVTLRVKASDVGSSVGDDPFAFHAVGGTVTVTSRAGTLRVPYLLVPRAQANVVGEVSGSRGGLSTATSTTTSSGRPTGLTVKLSNPGGALTAAADFYTWGLSDGRDVATGLGGSGYDLRAAGVQSFDLTKGKLVVFAVNNYDRWSSPASQEFDVAVDTDNDGAPNYVVFSVDSGLVTTGDANGLAQVFIYDVAKDKVVTEGAVPTAPTDSSTILLPVTSATLGLTASAGAFAYTVAGYTVEDDAAFDEFSSWASYNPWARAIADGAYEQVTSRGRVSVPVTVDPVNFATQKPKGLMVVVLDNRSGPKEALLLGVR